MVPQKRSSPDDHTVKKLSFSVTILDMFRLEDLKSSFFIKQIFSV